MTSRVAFRNMFTFNQMHFSKLVYEMKFWGNFSIKKALQNFTRST